MKRFPLVFILFAMLMVQACGRSTPSNFYLLESAASQATVDRLPEKSMRIAQVEVPNYLNRNNIVSRVSGETKLILAEFHLWAEPVANGVHRVIENELSPRLLTRGITVLPATSESRTDYTLLLDLQRLDGNFNEQAVLECLWTLLDRDDKPIDRGFYTAGKLVNGADYDILVATESGLLADFGAYLAERLPVLMESGRKAR